MRHTHNGNGGHCTFRRSRQGTRRDAHQKQKQTKPNACLPCCNRHSGSCNRRMRLPYGGYTRNTRMLDVCWYSTQVAWAQLSRRDIFRPFDMHCGRSPMAILYCMLYIGGRRALRLPELKDQYDASASTISAHEFHKWHILAFDCRIECKISDNSIRVISNEGVAIYCDVPMYGDDLLDSAGNRVRCRESTTCYATPILELNEKKKLQFSEAMQDNNNNNNKPQNTTSKKG